MSLKNKNKENKIKKLLKLAIFGLVVFGTLFLIFQGVQAIEGEPTNSDNSGNTGSTDSTSSSTGSTSSTSSSSQNGVPVIVYGDYLNLICEIDDFDEADIRGDEFYVISDISDEGEIEWEEAEDEEENAHGETDLEVYIRGIDENSRAQQIQNQILLNTEIARQREVGKMMCDFVRQYKGEESMDDEEKELCENYNKEEGGVEGADTSTEGTKWVENFEKALFEVPLQNTLDFIKSEGKYEDDGLEEVFEDAIDNAPNALQEGDKILDPNSDDAWGNWKKFVSEDINNPYGASRMIDEWVENIHEIEYETTYARDIVAGLGIYPRMDEKENIIVPTAEILAGILASVKAQWDLATGITYRPPEAVDVDEEGEPVPPPATIHDDPSTYLPHENPEDEREEDDPSLMNIMWETDFAERFELDLETLIDEWFQNLTAVELSILFDLTEDAANRIPSSPQPSPPEEPPPYDISFLNNLTGAYLKSLFPDPLLPSEILVVIDGEEKTLSLPASLVIATSGINASFFEGTAFELKGNTTVIQDATQNGRLTETSRSIIRSAIRNDFYDIIEEVDLTLEEEIQNATLNGQSLNDYEIAQALRVVRELISSDVEAITTRIINDIHP